MDKQKQKLQVGKAAHALINAIEQCKADGVKDVEINMALDFLSKNSLTDIEQKLSQLLKS